ncbi:MAG: hypothetical protein MN733_20305 [Nitrososphaera sp.]|nr:hypothetical protein [Nitrososphaera sp.]
MANMSLEGLLADLTKEAAGLDTVAGEAGKLTEIAFQTLDELKKEVETETAKPKAKQDETRIRILTAEFNRLRQSAELKQKDLAEEIVKLNDMFVQLQQGYGDLTKPTAEEIEMETRAADVVKAAEAVLSKLQNSKVVLFRGTRTETAQAEVTRAKTAEAEVKKQTTAMRRKRLMQADMRSSIQQFFVMCDRTAGVIEGRMKELAVQEVAVQTRLSDAFKLKEQAAEALKIIDEELVTADALYRQAEAELGELTNGTVEYSQKQEQVAGLKRKLEDLRSRQGTATQIYQTKERFVAMEQDYLNALIVVRGNLRTSVMDLKARVQEQTVVFQALLSVMQAQADALAAKDLRETGVKMDEWGHEHVAGILVASQEERLRVLEGHADLMRKVATVEAIVAEHTQTTKVREQQVLTEIFNLYGIDASKLSYTGYEGEKPAAS